MLIEKETLVKTETPLGDDSIPIRHFEKYLKNALQLDVVLGLVNGITASLLAQKKVNLDDIKPILEALTWLGEMPLHTHSLEELNLEGNNFVTQQDLQALSYLNGAEIKSLIDTSLKPLNRVVSDLPAGIKRDIEAQISRLNNEISNLKKIDNSIEVSSFNAQLEKIHSDTNLLIKNIAKTSISKVEFEKFKKDLEAQVLEKLKTEVKSDNQYYRIYKTFTQSYDGLVPKPTAADISSNYVLRADGDWVAQSGGGGTWGSITGTLSAQTDLQTALDGKQATLVSGTNIKTINSTSLLGSGDIVISGSVSDGDKGDITVTGTGATWTIDNSAVSLAKMADMATSSLIYRKTAGSGVPEVNTLATLKTDLGLTGTNSGDQTSIVGITGTKAEFDTAVTDGNFLYVGDVTQYTDEMAQDAVGAMVNTSLTYVDGTPSLGLTSRTINGTAFDGTANITVTAAAGTLTGTTLNSSVVTSSLTSLGSQAQDLNMNSHKITNVTDPTSAQDAATKAYVDTAVIGLLDYRGAYDASTNLFPATGGSGLAGAVLKGDFWICSVAGTLGGESVTAGDLIIAIVDTPAQTAANWDLIEHNIGTYVSSVSGTTDRVTSTGGATPVIDISATFEALLGKVANPLSQFAATTSSQLAGVISDETGSGALVFATSPTLVTPLLGTPTSGNLANCTFPTLNQNTTGSAATLTTTRTIWGQNFNGSANVTGDITLGASSITMTGSLAATGSRVTKGWFTDIESTNAPTIGGTAATGSGGLVRATAPTLSGAIQLAENASIDLDASLSADGTYSGIAITGTAGATLAFGDLIYLAVADSRWELADASAASTSGYVKLGICVLAAASDGSATKILLKGNVRADAAFPTFTIGASVYASETAGDVTSTCPSSGTDVVIRCVGKADTADTLYFNPSEDYYTLN